MRIAIISAVRSDWASAANLVAELGPTLASISELDPSIWLVDDGCHERPGAWSSLAPQTGRLHVLELQGHQGSSRALTTALGYLVCERDEQFDAFVLLEDARGRDARHVGTLLETSFLHPGAVIFGKVDPGSLPWRRRVSRRLLHSVTRALSGESLEESTLTFLPMQAAEALAHSCHAVSHVEAALRRLQLPSVCTPAARGSARRSGSAEMLEGLSVFRDRVFARAFAVSSLLCAISFTIALGLTAYRIAAPDRISAGSLALSWVVPLLLGLLASVTLLLGLGAQALNESRRWTPALDSALQLRSVRRVKRGPEAIAN